LTDAEREKPPAPGSIITFRYQELSDGGVPRFPSFVRVHAPPSVAISEGGKEIVAARNLNAEPMAPSSVMRRFDFTQGSSSKFWETEVRGNQLVTRWGRIGGAGQQKVKMCRDADSAAKEQAALIQEKLGKGYRET
jgi:DNA ligase-1